MFSQSVCCASVCSDSCSSFPFSFKSDSLPSFTLTYLRRACFFREICAKFFRHSRLRTCVGRVSLWNLREIFRSFTRSYLRRACLFPSTEKVRVPPSCTALVNETEIYAFFLFVDSRVIFVVRVFSREICEICCVFFLVFLFVAFRFVCVPS